MPTFCRHNRLIQNCPICTREQSIEPRPVLSSSAPRTTLPRTPSARTSRRSSSVASPRAAGGLKVRRLARGQDDGYRCAGVPGLKSSVDAERLAEELTFAATRLQVLAVDPPGLYAAVADPAGDVEERLWLAFLIVYLGPAEGPEPFSAIAAVRTPWHSGELPDLPQGLVLGARTAHDPGRGTRTLSAYRAWADRGGSQAAAFLGDAGWSAQRRFSRVYERLALPGLTRDARYDLLVTLGRLGVIELEAATLVLGGDNAVTVAAKRALGIGDPLLLERRSQALAEACEVPLDALDLGLFNWERGERAAVGIDAATEPAAEVLARVRRGLELG